MQFNQSLASWPSLSSSETCLNSSAPPVYCKTNGDCVDWVKENCSETDKQSISEVYCVVGFCHIEASGFAEPSYSPLHEILFWESVSLCCFDLRALFLFQFLLALDFRVSTLLFLSSSDWKSIFGRQASQSRALKARDPKNQRDSSSWTNIFVFWVEYNMSQWLQVKQSGRGPRYKEYIWIMVWENSCDRRRVGGLREKRREVGRHQSWGIVLFLWYPCYSLCRVLRGSET